MTGGTRVRSPLAIDLYAGLGGWSDGLLAEGWDCIGFDIEQHEYWVPDVVEDDARKNSGGSWFAIGGPGQKVTKQNPDSRNWAKDAPRTKMLRYPAQLVIQDVLTLHGSQFRNADLIVASPPCQFFSYCAMPWTRAKKLAADVRADPVRLEKELALFNACFRIQREACEAAGRHIPLIVENVRGAIPWVGRSRWNFGSYHLWGDVPALMPMTLRAQKVPGFRFDGSGKSFQTASVLTHLEPDEGCKSKGLNWGNRDLRGQHFARIAGAQQDGTKNNGARFTSRETSSKSPARKAASAMIAKIPEPLSRHIARSFKPQQMTRAA